MNKNKLRWKIYNILKKRNRILIKRGGYSMEYLENFIMSLYGLELGIYGNPVAALKELTPSLSSFF